MTEQKRCCENCGNLRCANSIIAYWWDECVDSNFEKHWVPKEEHHNGGYPNAECKWDDDETPDANDFCSYGVRKEETE